MTRREQLLRAAGTVTRRTGACRVKALRRMLCRELARKPDPRAVVVHYYLSLGTVPRSLWDD